MHQKTTTLRLVASLLTFAFALAVAGPALAASPVVNVNVADTAQLALLPRVGPALAQRIVDFREENGPFEAPEDLILVRGIGEKTFSLLAPYVALDGETTLTRKVSPSEATSEAGAEGDRR